MGMLDIVHTTVPALKINKHDLANAISTVLLRLMSRECVTWKSIVKQQTQNNNIVCYDGQIITGYN